MKWPNIFEVKLSEYQLIWISKYIVTKFFAVLSGWEMHGAEKYEDISLNLLLMSKNFTLLFPIDKYVFLTISKLLSSGARKFPLKAFLFLVWKNYLNEKTFQNSWFIASKTLFKSFHTLYNKMYNQAYWNQHYLRFFLFKNLNDIKRWFNKIDYLII